MSEKKQSVSVSAQSRRQMLTSIGAGSVIGLAGCLGGNGTGNGNDSVDKVTHGLAAPLSGAYSTAGQNIINVLELAGQQAVEADEIGEYELLTGDSQSDPSEAVNVAREHIENGADFIHGGLSGASANAVAKLCEQQNILQMASDSRPIPDIEECLETAFQHDNAMPGWAENPLGYLAREGLGNKVYQIHANASFPDSYNDFTTSSWADERGIEFVETKAVPFGTTDYASIMNDVKSTDAEIVNICLYGNDALSALSQAVEFGLVDEGYTISTPIMDPAMGPGVPEELLAYEDSYYGLVGGYGGIDTKGMQNYKDEISEEYDMIPGGETVWYNGARTLLQAAGKAGTTDTDSVVDTLRGQDLVPDLWGNNPRFRECDKRVTIPAVTMRGNPDGNHDEGMYFEVIEKITDLEKIMYSCEDIACNQ